MPARGISSFADSDIEDASNVYDENSALSIEQGSASPEPTKKQAGRAKGSTKGRVTKPKTTTTRKAPEGAPKRTKKAAAPKRKALEEHINGQVRGQADVAGQHQNAVATADSPMPDAGESEDELESPRTLAQDKQAVTAKTVSKKSAKPKSEGTKRAKQAGEAKVPANRTKEVQVEEINHTIAESQVEDVQAATPSAARPASKSGVVPSHQFGRTARNEPSFRHRAGSASDSERNGGDPQLRRKLGDMTRKFESADFKYRNLRETGILEANANVEKLRKQCEATTTASNELVSSLRKELAMQTSMAQEYRKIQKTLQSRDAENAKLLSSVSELTSGLSAAQNEVRALQAKLAASRTAATAVESTNGRTPGSAMKPNVPTRTVMVGSAEAAQAAQNAQLKEDLYSDLTGLIVRGVKRSPDEDTFDCIQTGRNGTLHFKLTIMHDNDGKPVSFEDTEFLYSPMLDQNRDRDMLEFLPDYLTEEITFSRQHAAKFYSRVVETLTRKRADE